MAYGTIKVDTITFTDGAGDKSVTISGLVQNPTFTGNVTVTGTVSGTTATFTTGTFTSLTGTTSQGTTATYTSGSFTSLTGVTTSGTTANFVSGVFTTQISGATITGTAGAFATLTGGVATLTSGVFALGTQALPSITFTGDTDTGIYSPGANQVAITTSGTGRLFINSDGTISVGDVVTGDGGIVVFNTSGQTTANLSTSTNNGSFIVARHNNANSGAGGAFVVGAQGGSFAAIKGLLTDGSNNTAGDLAFSTRATSAASTLSERLRITSTGTINIKGAGTAGVTQAVSFDGSAPVNSLVVDSSGRLLVGTSSAREINSGNDPLFQVERAAGSAYVSSFTKHSADAFGPHAVLIKTRGTTVGSNTAVVSGDEIGSIDFMGTDGTNPEIGASITAFVDGTPGTNDMPGRLVFSTTADGASVPTERMRITNKGACKITEDGGIRDVNSSYHELRNNLNSEVVVIETASSSYTSFMQRNNCYTAASSSYTFFDAHSGNFDDREFHLRGDGNAFADGSWSGGGADYAEYFEWSDSNPDAEDRRGISVVLDGDKIREAVAGEDPIGVISGNPSVVGDAAWNKWSGKYLRDEYGTYIQEDYEVEDEDGNTVIQQRRKLNPAYDPDMEYISREDRPEWDCVGLMGKLRIRKGQATGSRWIKMRDISATVEEWLVR